MKQIEKKMLCYYCLGCNKQADTDYKPMMRCKNFIAGIEDWQEKLREEIQNEKSKN